MLIRIKKEGNEMRKIVEYTRSLFDAVGVVNNFLILGLESRVERNLDTFIWNGKDWKFPGFYQYFTPKTRSVIQRIREKGFRAQQIRYSKLNIKELAVKAGLGKWGKNSLVIHPEFGPWLRFVAIETDAPLPQAPPIRNSRLVFPGCENCNRCLKACPVNGLLKPFRLKPKEKCLAYIQLTIPPTISPTATVLRRCDKCLTACMPQSRE